MLKVRWLGWVGLLLLAMAGQAAEEQLGIVLGKHRVHPTRILARYKDPQASLSLQNLDTLAQLGVAIRRTSALVPGAVSIDLARGAIRPQASAPADPAAQAEALVQRIAALRRTGLFLYVEPDYVRYPLITEPNDERYVDGTLWGLRNDGGSGGIVGADISAREAWDLTQGSTNVVVAVIDSGIRYTHQELASQMWRNPGEIPGNGEDDDGNGVVDDVFGINAFDPQNVTGDPMDGDDHGTHVAGTIGAAANDGNPHVGVAWKVQLMGCRFLGAQGGSTEGAIACIEYAVTNGASILNNSWGGGGYSGALSDAIELARSRGVLFVAAAGNSAINNDEDPHYPSSYPHDNIISVAALDRGDNLANFSNYGLTSVDLGAPGVEIFSSISLSDSSYGVFDGTSMASPHVAGVAALIRARYPGISLYELRERLLQTVVPVAALQGLSVTGGRVNAYKALVAVGDGEMELALTPDRESVLLTGSTQMVYAVVTDMFGVTNATVTGRFLNDRTGTLPTLTFVNNGTAPDQTPNDATYSTSFRVPTGVTELQLEVTVTAPGKTTLVEVFRWYVAEPPTNDMFAQPSKIAAEGGQVLSNNKFATFEVPDEPFHAGVPTVDATLWWVWSPEVNNRALIDTAGTEFDAVLAVYTGSTLRGLTNVVSADDAGGRQQPYVQFDAVAGTTYRIVVGGTSTNETGSLRLRVVPNGIPDTLAPAIGFTSPPSGVTVTTNKWVVKGTAADLESGSGVSGVQVRSNDDLVARRAAGTTNWSATFVLRPGVNRIYASASDYARNVSEEVSMTINFMPPTVANDHYANALVLEGSSGGIPCNTTYATREFGEPRHGGNEGGHSLWYRWQAPSDGVLTVATTNVNFDTLLGVYTGSTVTNLFLVGGNDDLTPGSRYSAVSVGVKLGGVYSIAVDGFAGRVGTCRLNYSFAPTEIRLLTVASTSGGRVKPGSGNYASGSTVVLTATPDPGFAFLGWEGTVASTLNPLTLVMNQDYALTARFGPEGYTDDFERGTFSTDLRYLFSLPGSDKGWGVQSGTAAGGTFAARSGAISGLQESALGLTAVTTDGVGSFAYRVSSEATWDRLDFYLNGELKQTWSGNVPWDTYRFMLQAGTNVLTWRYSKDATLDLGDDAAYLDNISLPLASATEPNGVRLQMLGVPGGLTLELQGETGRTYVIQGSSDLKQWSDLSTAVAVDGVVRVPVQPTASTVRFYRAVVR